ncbi:outer envelope protein 61-like [Asparagus officinalis]|uniref:outer envelope protein 61-like n=1 Tax=Asparagus officinalis TaxID=4686 RepID=UPI00098E7897|nr:outer envelope protein 61-like [Asparagus officinalis]
MLEIAYSMNVSSTNAASDGSIQRSESRLSSQIPEMTPEMVKMASDRMSNMSLEEVQKKSEIASSMNLNGFPSNPTSENTTQRSESGYQASTAEGSHTMDHLDARESSSDTLFSNPRNAQASSSHPGSSADLQETLRNSMKDPVMRQMFTSMMKSISP